MQVLFVQAGALNLSHLKYEDKQKDNPTQNNPNKTKSNCIFIYKCFALQHSANALRILNVPPVWVCVCVDASVNTNVNDGVVFRNNTARAKNARELRLLLLHSGWQRLIASLTDKKGGGKTKDKQPQLLNTLQLISRLYNMDLICI